MNFKRLLRALEIVLPIVLGIIAYVGILWLLMILVGVDGHNQWYFGICFTVAFCLAVLYVYKNHT